MRKRLAALLACLLATSCTPGGDDGVLNVAIIGTTDQLFADGVRLSPPGQHIRAAQAQGLVRLDEAGNVVPAIAERWIVTDDGVSYIFRIREFDLPGGGRLQAPPAAPAAGASRGAFGQRQEGAPEAAPMNRAQRRAQERKG